MKNFTSSAQTIEGRLRKRDFIFKLNELNRLKLTLVWPSNDPCLFGPSPINLPAPMKNLLIRIALLAFMTLTAGLLPAQVPQLISYQGRVGGDGVNFDGSGHFKSAFVNAAGGQGVAAPMRPATAMCQNSPSGTNFVHGFWFT